MQTRSGIHQARRNHDSAGKQGPHLAAANPEYSSLAAQLATGFQAAALTWLGLLAVVAIVLWVIRLLSLRLSSRR